MAVCREQRWQASEGDAQRGGRGKSLGDVNCLELACRLFMQSWYASTLAV